MVTATTGAPAGRTAGQGGRPAGRSAARHRSNLPIEVSSFVGRRRELAEVRRLLASYRLVTLTGVGGVGKTRLALRAGCELQRSFRDGVFLVDFAGLRDPALVGHAAAGAVGLRDTSSRWAIARLSDHLADRHLLLVLDNCEHLVDACAVLADALLRSCPRVRILATSRQALGVEGECAMRVPSLTVPNPDRLPPPEGLMRYEAVTLFADRAAAVQPGFEITAENYAAVARLCQRLDGMPLAIELAAVRLRALSVQQVLDRLEDRYHLLTSGSRVALPRQQTLRGLMDWSFELLSPEERRLWARLSVFAGSFELDAAERVCGDINGFVPELVAELVDKSILVREEGPHVPGAGEPRVRYRLLETIRQYGQERLREQGAEQELRRRHRDCYLHAVEAGAQALFGPGQVELYLRTRAEHPNLRAALEYCLDVPGEVLTGLRMAAKLQHYWVMTGNFSEGRRWLHRLLARVDEAPAADEAAALAVLGRLAVLQGDADEGLSLLGKARGLADTAGARSAAADAAHAEGLAAMFWGDPATALAWFEKALEGQRAVSDLFGTALALVQLATARSVLGDVGGAFAASDECLALCREHGERWCAALALWTQALADWHKGDLSQASARATQTLRLKQPFGDRMGMAMCMEVLAWVAAAHGRGDRAARLLGAVHAAWRSIGASLFRHLIPDHERCEARARDMLGRSTFDAFFAEGAALPFDDAVAFALEERGPAATGTTSRRSVVSRRSAATSLSLTRREAQIADLVAQGLSNREIAEALVIAPRTAEGHVERILSKLGFTSRAQIAAWVAENRARPGAGSVAPR